MKLLLFVVASTSAILLPLRAGAGAPPGLDAAIRACSDEPTNATYVFSLVDPSDDAILDAVVLSTDQSSCGSGGCAMGIFKGTGNAFRLVSSTVRVREPISVLTERRYGCHTLSVLVAGGGATPGQIALRFNGSKYPFSPYGKDRTPIRKLETAKALKLSR